MRIAIVGAGLTGLVAARELVARGHEVTLFDKGRAVGGRMASKRLDGARFDHGAQHFSVRSEPFRSLVDDLEAAGVVEVWYEGESITTDRGVEQRHRGVPYMRAICEHLADGLDVRLATRVRSVGEGRLTLESGESVETDAVIVTAPIPQALDLVDEDLMSDEHRATLEAIDYDPCIAVMAVLEESADLPDGHLSPDTGPIAWIADNRHKGISDVAAATIHSTPVYARAHLEADPSVWLSDLLAEFERLTGADVESAAAHRWRYSIPTNPLDSGHLDVGTGIWLAGEAFSGARIEGAFTSGRAVAAEL